MADYIDKNILCEAYVHVELPDVEGVDLEAIKSHLSQFASSRAQFFIYPEVSVEVEFREGSLKSYITVAGCIYAAICHYGDFRSGIDYLYTDIKRLADTMVAESLFMTKARHANIKRTEARTGIVGSLKLLVDEINAIERDLGHVSVDEAARRLKRLHEDATTLLSNVRSDEDMAKIEVELDKFADDLPDKCPHPIDKVPESDAISWYQDVLAEFRKHFGSGKQKKPSHSSA